MSEEIIDAMESFFGECINAVKQGWIKAWTTLMTIKSVERDMESLRKTMDELRVREQDVMMELEREEVQQGKKRKREVDVWLENVKRFKGEVEKVRVEKGWISRYKLSKHITDMKIEAVQLQEKSRFSNGVAIEPLLGIPCPQPAATLIGKSAKETMKRIWNHLLDVEIKKVGVYGMAGVGKTTIVKHISNELINSNVFKSIIWVTVSKALDLNRLQQEIASAIELNLSNAYDNEESMSSKIHAALSRREGCLLILDDLWKPFSLDRIGIPEPNQTNGFKLVITTRSLMVCRGMESERTVKVETLSPEEAWDLFEEKVSGHVLDSLEIKPIAELIVKECDCLPLAIITVGRALREVGDVSVWRNALNELKCSYTEIDGMDDYVFPRLMFSYNRLKNDRLRGCFLYCALYPEDYQINAEELIENWVGEGLIDEMENKERERDKGYTILRELIDACMINSPSSENSVGRPNVIQLHDLLRDLAINITRASPRFMVKAREHLEESPRVDEWVEDMKRVSLMENNIKILSGRPMCPQLTTLFLQGNYWLSEISNSFFENAQGFRVVDLSQTGINSLPESFSVLKNLRILKLNSCQQLHKVPCLAKLRHLRVLSLDGTFIEELPQGVEDLVNLKKLSLNCTGRLKLFPAGIIPKLSCLRELQMIESGWRWPSNTVRAAADIEEIVNSTRITHLRLSFDDVQGFNNLVGSGKLLARESFCIALGKAHINNFIVDHLKCVVVGSGVVKGSHASTLMLPSYIEGMKITELHDITSLSQFSYPSNENQLNLAFVNLKELTVMSCKQMKSLLSVGLLQDLRNLELLFIGFCPLMEDVVVDDGHALTTISLPRLWSIHITDLPELKSIFKTTVTCSSLKYIKVYKCPKLKKLPFTSVENIYGNREWWDALEWDDPDIKVHLQDRVSEWDFTI